MLPFDQEAQITDQAGDPLVLAGGPQADNPEPLAEFLDLVVIGDEHQRRRFNHLLRLPGHKGAALW